MGRGSYRGHTLSRLKDIAPDFVEEITFIKEIYKIYLNIPLSPKPLPQEIVTKNLVHLFPNVFVSLIMFSTLPIYLLQMLRDHLVTRKELRTTSIPRWANSVLMDWLCYKH